MKVLVICGSGVGSSLMVSMNIKSILNDLNVKGVDVDNTDLASASPSSADVVVIGKDLSNSLQGFDSVEIIVLNSIIDKKELADKITATLSARDLI